MESGIRMVKIENYEYLGNSFRIDGCLLLDARQKPCFPVDVVCRFNRHNCGFKKTAWAWIPQKGTMLKTGGYLECELNYMVPPVGHVRSVNFHGLSDLDSERGPKGCIKFMYQFEGFQERPLSLELFRMGLKTTFDVASDDSISIWSGMNYGSANWSRVSVPVDVSAPFALQFEFKLLEGSIRGSVKVDNLEVRYTACDHPSHATWLGSKVTQLKSSSKKSMKSLKYMMPPSLSFRSSAVGSSSSKLSKDPPSKVGWLRSLSGNIFKSKKSQSLGSSSYSFGSFSSKQSGVSATDIPKVSTEK